MKSVCKGCTERRTACWGSCKKYLEAKEEHDKHKKEREKAIVLHDMIESVHYNGKKYERNNRRQKT